jgi:maltooligosyltrehalose trehalohydrolase
VPIAEWGHDARWADGLHHALHALLTGEREGYYGLYGSVADVARELERRPPERHVVCAQNHDQIGNRALGDRLTPELLRVASAVVLFSEETPLLFMGEELGARAPFLFFTNYEGDLAEAVKQGRRKEFGKFAEFATEEAQRRIPDPNKAETFQQSRPSFVAEDAWSRDWQGYVRRLIALRHAALVPHLDGARSDGAQALTRQALQARWILGDGTRLTLAANFGPEPISLPPVPGRHLFAHGKGDCIGLAGKSFLAILGAAP